VIFAAGSKTPSWELEPDTLGTRGLLHPRNYSNTVIK